MTSFPDPAGPRPSSAASALSCPGPFRPGPGRSGSRQPKPVLLALLSGLCLAPSVSRAQLEFDVSLNTAPLIGHTEGPFFIDFQLLDGSGTGDGNNTVVLSGFDFHGGGWVGTVPAPLTVTDTRFFTEFTGQFTPGTSLGFRVTLTSNVDVDTPDQFSFAILRRLGPALPGPEIPTTGPGNALLLFNLDSPSPSPLTFPSDLSRTDIDLPAATVTSVPEPAWLSAAVAAALVVVASRRAGRGRGSDGSAAR